MLRSFLLDSRRRLIAVATALLVWPAVCAAQQVDLALDFAPGAAPIGTRTGDWMTLGDGILFSRIHPDDRVELWFTNGTQAGTRMLVEGSGRSADGELFGVELGDGTALMVFAGFSEAGVGRELWRTDGTLEGTTLFSDLCPGPCDGFVELNGGNSDFQQRDGKTYFLGQAQPGQQRLYVYDPAGGLEVVTELPAVGFALGRAPLPGPNTNPPADVILVVSQEVESGEGSLWVLRLGLGIEESVAPIATPSVVSMLPFRDGALAVMQTASAEDGLFYIDHNGLELVSADAASVTPLRISTASGNSLQERAFTYRRSLGGCQVLLVGASAIEVQVVGQFSTSECWSEAQVMGQRLVFAQPDGPAGGRVLATNSTNVGTFVLARNSESAKPQGISVLGAEQVVWLDQVNGSGLVMTSNGLGVGSAVHTFVSIDGASFGDAALPIVNGSALLIADGGSGRGLELWRSDGTSPGTTFVAALTPDLASSMPQHLFRSDLGLLFAPADPPGLIEEDARDLWVLPGAQSGPELIAADRMVVHETGARLIVDASPAMNPKTVVALDPATGLEETVLEPPPGAPQRFISGSVQVGSRVVLRTSEPSGSGSTAVSLWASDGTLDGTTELVGDLAIADSSPLVGFRTRRGAAALTWGPGVNTNGNQTSVWISDGTPSGSRLLSAAMIRHSVQAVTEEHAYVLVTGQDSSSFLATIDLSDGNLDLPSARQRVVFDLGNPPTDPPYGSLGVGVRGRFVYQSASLASDPGDGEPGPTRQLSSSDATLSGTVVLGEFESLSAPRSGPAGLAYFSATRAIGRSELWVTDGTVAGTLNLGVSVSAQQVNAAEIVDGVLAFAATTAENGTELWLTDGTVAGTRQIDVEPGPVGSGPKEMEASGDKMYFAAYRSDVGRELFSIDRSALRTACEPSETRACLGAGRFAVEAEWFDRVSGDRGRGRAQPFRTDTGRFWFFEEGNVELVFKVLDARSFSDHFWVFYGALSDVSYWLTVTDTWSGESRTYSNEQGDICGALDLTAFALEPELDDLAPTDDSTVSGPVASRVLETHPVEEPPVCGETVLCLQDDRFRVSVDFQVLGEPEPGVGIAVVDPGGTDDETGYFWFFTDQNIELAIKVIDGRTINDNWWLFYGGLSDVEYTITVVDTMTGLEKIYWNEQGSICGDADIGAFPDEFRGH